MTDDTSQQKRGRRWRRIRLAILAGILVLLVVYVGLDWYSGRRLEAATARFEQRHGALSTPVVTPSVPAADNRAKVVKAAAAMIMSPSSSVRSAIGRIGTSNAASALTDELQAFVDANAGSLRLANEIKLRHQSSWEVDYINGDNSWQRPLIDSRTLGEALYVSASIDLEKGRLDAAAARAVDALAVVASLRQEPSLIAQLVRISNVYHPLDVIQRMLASAEPSPAALTTLAAWLAENREPDGIRTALLGESRYVNSTSGQLEGGRLARPFLRMARGRYLDTLSQLIDIQAGPRPRPPFPILGKPGWWSPIDRLNASVFSGLERTVDTGDDFMTRLACAELAVALHRYRVEHRGYPDDLMALVPAYVPRLPLDMFTGKPPIYARQGTGFTLRASRSETYSPLHRPLPEWTSTGGVQR